MARYRPESFVNEVLAYLRANLNTNINAVSSEYSDEIILAELDNEAYFVGSLNDKVGNFVNFCLLTVSNNPLTPNGQNLGEELSIAVALLIPHDGTTDFFRRMLRYQEALKDTFRNAYRKIAHGRDWTVKTLEPLDAQLLGSSNWHKVIGVEVSISLG